MERVNKKILKKMKVYNKTVIDWLLGQQQFCLTDKGICCPQPAALGNRSFLGSNKIAVVLEPVKTVSDIFWTSGDIPKNIDC